MSSKVAKLGLAAVLAYGIFDGVTYTSFFVLAFLGYEKSTGKNPAANLQALVGVRAAFCYKSFWIFSRVRIECEFETNSKTKSPTVVLC